MKCKYETAEECNLLIDSFGDLKENWDSYGAATIDEPVRERAKKLVLEIHDQYKLVPEFICPTCNGDISVEYANELEIEVFSDPEKLNEYCVWAGPELISSGNFEVSMMKRLVSL